MTKKRGRGVKPPNPPRKTKNTMEEGTKNEKKNDAPYIF
jgi:hypothetical protein